LNKTGIESGIGTEMANSLVFPDLPSFIGKPIFEEICRQYLIRKNKEKALPFLASNFGCWWGSDPALKTNADVRKLISKAHLIPGYKEYHFIFFSKSPYTEAARRLEQKNLSLVTVDMMFRDV